MGEARKRPRELLDAALAWVVRESGGFEPATPAQPQPLNARTFDYLLIASACAPFLAIALG
jgi:hypothetical protein